MAGKSPEQSRHRSGPWGPAGWGLLAAAGTAAAVLAVSTAPAPARTPAQAQAQAQTPGMVPARAVATTGAGNGIEGQSARQIADRTVKALLGAGSLRARVVDNTAKNAAHRPSVADLTLDRQGNCTGSLTLGDGGGSVALIKRGNQVWARPDQEFWKKQFPEEGSAIVKVVGHRFVHGTAGNAFLKQVAQFCDLNNFRKGIKAAGSAGSLTKGHPTTVSGTRTVPLTGTVNNRSTTLFVSAVGTPYPLKAAVKGKQVNVTTTLSRFNQPVLSKTPPASDSIDISKLASQLPG